MKYARLIGAVVCALVTFASPHLAAQQQTYPTRPVSLVVPFPAGGSPDVLARIIAEKVSADWGVPVLFPRSTLLDRLDHAQPIQRRFDHLWAARAPDARAPGHDESSRGHRGPLAEQRGGR